ncbi:MAG: hypothetical protein EOP62_15945 [Sphingomonadales bacterium]|nr:MAG: hypothetical protein EOP62_15945 [Sphingomonadales bacterium]
MISDDDVRRVLDQNQTRLLALPHVIAAGIIDVDSAPTIAIYVDTLDAELYLPDHIEAVIHGDAVSVPTAIKLMGTLNF